MVRDVTFKAVLLSGGSGERFWPLSTSAKPKQFLSFFGSDSLIASTAKRLAGFAAEENIYVVTTKELVKRTKKELPFIPRSNIFGEPCKRNTTAAIKFALTSLDSRDDDVIGFFPADQLVGDGKKFISALKKAIAAAKSKDVIVTIGIKPTNASTAYGYVDCVKKTFMEKPNLSRARQLVKKGCLWNAGMFIARKSVFSAAISKYAPMFDALGGSKRRIEKEYALLPSVQFDVAVMEKASLDGAVEVIPGDFAWDDVGSLLAFERHYPKDKCGNVTIGDVTSVESSDNILVSNSGKITTLGLKDVVVISTKDNILVASKSEMENIKKIFL
jgi:mannose-1-phosphate guanylyltransferase